MKYRTLKGAIPVVHKCMGAGLSLLLLLLISPPLYAQQAIHLGVASCAASTCHGSTVEYSQSNIQRDEFRVWNETDPHARAYQTLLTPESQLIANKLGLVEPHKADTCLNCHSDNVPQDLRGEQFVLADGVGCEVCHGGASEYLKLHTDGDHNANLEAGMYRTELPKERAELCVSCHVGDQHQRKIDHQIMGAGHPRLSFELNTFSSIQPAHYQVDEDYRERKGEISELQIWAVGQVQAASQFLYNVESAPRSGLFPEFVHLDCLGCHQDMSKITWTNNPLTQQSAGALRYNDAYLMMSYQIALAVTPANANELLSSIRGFLATANQQQNLQVALTRLRVSLMRLQTYLLQHPLTLDQGAALLNSLLDISLVSSHRDYASAEQAAMAINTVLRAINDDQTAGLNQELNQVKPTVIVGIDLAFDGLQNSDDYQPDMFVSGLKRIKAALLKSR